MSATQFLPYCLFILFYFFIHSFVMEFERITSVSHANEIRTMIMINNNNNWRY